MAIFGRQLQVVGLVALPLAILLQVSNSISVPLMLGLAVMGFALFWIGRILEGYARKE
jgi:hypothetical protein